MHNKKERPKERAKSTPAKPVVVGGTMGFMSWLAEAKSKTETEIETAEEEFVASDEEIALETVSEEVADQSPKAKQVCGFRTGLHRK